MAVRTIRKLHEAQRDDIRDLQTRRPLPNDELDQLDPFLFLNHHGPQVYPPRNGGLPFGPHPHRGFETITFILEGDLMHLDSGGHKSVIRAGGVQWMTAGSGLEHAELSSEEFMKDGGPLEILQLWHNLPARLKMTKPRYIGLQKDDIPVVETQGAAIQVISGEVNGKRGPIEPITDVFMTTVQVAPGANVRFPVARDRTVFLYVVRGALKEAPAFHLVELESDGDEVELAAGDQGAFVLFGHELPYGERVVAYGPFVMSSQEQIMQAIRDYQAGKFGAV